MVTYVEFRAHERKHPGKETPTGKGHYDGVDDFVNFAKDRNLSVLITDIGHAYAVGDCIIAHLIDSTQKDIDKIETKFKGKVHWPILISGYDPRIEARTVGRFFDHLLSSTLHEVHLKKGRRKKEW